MAAKEIRIGQQVIHEDDLKFPVEYNGETFVMKYPSPFEKSAIEVDIARRLDGNARSAFPADHVQMVEATAYVDNLVVRAESPGWFKSAWTCYDEELIGTLYTGYLRFRGDFQARIRAGELEGTGKAGKS